MAFHPNDLNYDSLFHQLSEDLKTLPETWQSLNDARDSIYSLIRHSVHDFLNCQSKEYQNNEEFKTILFSTLENIVMISLHEKIFSLICMKFQLEDEMIYKKCTEMWALQVSADQLGALEEYAIPLPAAVVELASLDLHTTPTAKFNSISTAFDLVLAELKTAIVDIIAHNSDNGIPTLSISDITPILATVIIHARPIHLISNMFYTENFRWSSKCINDNESILAFTTAVDKLKVVTTDVLQPRSSRIYCDVQLKDVLKITSDADDNYDNTGRRTNHPKNPLERHIENFTNKIAAATLSNIDV